MTDESRWDAALRACAEAPAPTVAVAGDRMERPIYAFVRACDHLLADEQAKPNPDNALIAVLCDAVRLTRELEAMAKEPLRAAALAPPTDVEAILKRLSPWLKHNSRGALCCAEACFCGMSETIQKLKSALAPPEPPCVWTLEDEDGSAYQTSCGEMFEFNVGTPAENKAKFCQYCGKSLSVAASPRPDTPEEPTT